jgi:hypothetical protein
MKISTERIFSHPSQAVYCVVCGQPSLAEPYRAILSSDRGLIQGTVCPQCCKLKAIDLQQKLHDRGMTLLRQSYQLDEQGGELRDRAQELLQLAQEPVKSPNFLQRWFKQMTILSEETQELEAARLGQERICCQQRSRLERLLKQDC